MNPKNHTLFGGQLLTVTFEPTEAELGTPNFAVRTEEIRVRQLPLRDYEAGFGLVHDEIAFAGFLCGKDRAWALTLQPGSFEQIVKLGAEVNQEGFFAWCGRRQKREQAALADQVAMMATLPPDVVKLAFAAGQAAISPTLPPPSQRRPAV